MNPALSVNEYRDAEPAPDGFLLLSLLALQGWAIQITLHDLGVEVIGRRDADEIVKLGGSVAQVAVDFFESAHHASRLRVAPEPAGARAAEETGA
jgi:hypothetical protein